ncbi:MAG: hypothetical protein JWR16_527 [Nevskia sp.]|nr:hypothetical protein [Nevskia sp.]
MSLRRRAARRCIGTLLLALACSAAQAAAPAAGTVVMLTGAATAAAPAGKIRPLAKDAPVYASDILNTASNSFLNLKFSDGGYILIRPDSRFEVRDFVDISANARAAAAEAAARDACAADLQMHIDACPLGAVMPLREVRFVTATQLAPAALAALARLADALQQQPQIVVEIGVYTADPRSAAVNRGLAADRAAAIKQFLTNRGVAAERLSVQGYGKRSAPGAAHEVELKFLAVAATPSGATDAAVALAPFAARPTQAAEGVAPATEAEPGSHAFFSLLKGGFRAVSGAIGKVKHEDYEVATPVATIGIRGTDYLAVLCDANCAHDPIIDPLLAPDVDARGGVVFGDIGGSIVITSAKGQYVLLPNQYVLVLPDGSFVPLPSVPYFLITDPLPDPQNCGVPG